MKSETPLFPPIFVGKMDKLQSLCREHHVKRLWAFGSALREDFHTESDIDLLYELDREKITDSNYLTHFFGLYDSLKVLFGREVDLIKFNAIQNPYFLAELEETKVLLYDQSKEEISI